MNKRHLAVISIVAAFSLLAFVFSAWMKRADLKSSKQISQSEQFYCVVPKSSSVYLTEVKPRIEGFGTSTMAMAAPPFLFFERGGSCIAREKIADAPLPRPLWLLNRSLLI